VITAFKEKFDNRHQIAAQIKKDGRKIIGCFYGAIPKELIHAAGMVPVQLIEDRDYRYEAKSKILSYLCGMSKNLTGQIYDRIFDYVDAVMVSTVCDTNRHVPDIWERNKVFPKTWIVQAPIKADEGAVAYYTGEVKRLADELGALSGQPVTEERLRQSLALYNENRALFRQFRKVRPEADITAEEALYVFASALILPVEEHNAMLKALLDSLSDTAAKDSGTRLMICALNLNLAQEVIRMAEKYGARVVMDDFTHNARYGSEEIAVDDDVYRSLAEGYLRKVPMPGMYSFEQRAANIREMMQTAKAEGLIYIIQLYCDAYAMEYAVLKEYFDRWNLPHLKIEAEDTPMSVEQLNVRVQSFMESLV
jgi:benzoyl-CoA reductase/2-hydroxyglutaryl-CoA dehydratase subunit BcrC/BadD/HgdB